MAQFPNWPTQYWQTVWTNLYTTEFAPWTAVAPVPAPRERTEAEVIAEENRHFEEDCLCNCGRKGCARLGYKP